MCAGYRILIFEPDAALGQALMTGLSTTGRTIVWCDKGAEATALLGRAKVDVAVVSLSSDGKGLELIDRIGETSGRTPIPFLVATAADEIETRMLGLDRGAADYLIRPFTADELLARVSTVLRRRENSHGRFVRRGEIVLDRETWRFGDGLSWTALSPKERKVFSLLFGYGDRPVSKQRLRSALADEGCMTDNAIEVLIHRLRIKARSWGMHIQTHRGLGYALEDS